MFGAGCSSRAHAPLSYDTVTGAEREDPRMEHGQTYRVFMLSQTSVSKLGFIVSIRTLRRRVTHSQVQKAVSMHLASMSNFFAAFAAKDAISNQRDVMDREIAQSGQTVASTSRARPIRSATSARAVRGGGIPVLSTPRSSNVRGGTRHTSGATAASATLSSDSTNPSSDTASSSDPVFYSPSSLKDQSYMTQSTSTGSMTSRSTGGKDDFPPATAQEAAVEEEDTGPDMENTSLDELDTEALVAWYDNRAAELMLWFVFCCRVPVTSLVA